LFLRIPAAGYYNDDKIVDFMIRLNTGPGFPIYYDSKVRSFTVHQINFIFTQDSFVILHWRSRI